jgi:hypothetical protein
MYVNPTLHKRYYLNSQRLKSLYEELESLYYKESFEWSEYRQILKSKISDLEDIQIKIYKEANEQKQHRCISRAQEALRVRFSNVGNRSDY